MQTPRQTKERERNQARERFACRDDLPEDDGKKCGTSPASAIWLIDIVVTPRRSICKTCVARAYTGIGDPNIVIPNEHGMLMANMTPGRQKEAGIGSIDNHSLAAMPN